MKHTIILVCIECGSELQIDESTITPYDWMCDCGGDMVRKEAGTNRK